MRAVDTIYIDGALITPANANLSIARAHDDEEDRMPFQSNNPATGELIGT